MLMLKGFALAYFVFPKHSNFRKSRPTLASRLPVSLDI